MTGRVRKQVTLMNSLETEVVVNKEDGPEFGQRELVRKVSPNIQRLRQVFEAEDEEEAHGCSGEP